ncbi:dynamin family protein [Roseobacter sp. CCS2]|uniref:dynamin family protein n=1 Tax=Roseobacter sp. CCS2 TaxID=391593 RepID=UPI0000F3E213|nr:dynamin family protein [Roseobacter sp. CCS2]EBA12409.1 hypothetical protein RCCS2_13969 [Roseobacter sp. CCS2]
MRKANQVSDIAKQHMAAWHSQRPSFALMGEFSSGKSTLLNMLIGRPVLPAKVTVTKLPVIWMTFGALSACEGLTQEGQLHELDSTKPDVDLWDQYLVVRMTLDAPMLQYCDVIDTPGISDPRLAAGSLKFIAEFMDFAIWCTAANQAWRQSEKSAWKSLPKRLRDNSILAITRADQLASSTDLDKVTKRLVTETTGLFNAMCPIASHRAMDAAEMGQVTDPASWNASGGETLLAAIKSSINVAQQIWDTREAVAPPVEATNTATDQRPKDVPDEAREAYVKTASAQSIAASLSAAVSQIRQPISKDIVLATVGQVRDVLLHDQQLDDAHAEVLASCLSVNGSDSLDYARVLTQVEQEVEDFAKGAWCYLASEG